MIRIISENAADRAVITADNTALGMGTEFLKTDIRGEVCRVLGSSASIVLEWDNLAQVGAVVLPMSSLGASSTIRVRAYLDKLGTVLIEDTGVKFAVPGALLANWDFTQQLNVNLQTGTYKDQPLNVNAFTDTYIPIASVYFSQQWAIRKLVIDLVDPSATFIDISRLVVGGYSEFQYGAAYGASVSTLDFTKNSRAESGDSKSEWGSKASTLSFDLEWVSSADRSKARQLISRGIGSNMFFSLLPQHADPVLERDYSIYGKMAQTGSLAFNFYNIHNTQFRIESF